jgi:hypothetical protein
MTAPDALPGVGPEPGVEPAVAVEPAADGGGEHPASRAVDWLIVALISVLAGFVALVGLMFLPAYVGSVPLPVSALLGVGAMILAPRACYRLTGSLAAALAPVLTWFAVSVWFVLKHNPVLPTVPLTVVQGQWRVMLLLGLGSLAAAATVGLLWADRLKVRMAAQRAAAPGAAPDPAPLGPSPSG